MQAGGARARLLWRTTDTPLLSVTDTTDTVAVRLDSGDLGIPLHVTESLCQRMRVIPFQGGDNGKQLGLRNAAKCLALYQGKGALCQGAGLVEQHAANLRQSQQLARRCHQHAFAQGGTQCGRERQWHCQGQGAGAGNHQYRQGMIKGLARPGGPMPHQGKGGQ